MTSVATSVLEHPSVGFMGWTLVVVLWQTTLIGLILAVWLALRRDASASYRYNAALACLILAVVVAFSAPLQLARMQTARVAPTARAARAVDVSSGRQILSRQPSTDSPVDIQPSPVDVSADAIAAGAAVVWAVGFVCLVFRILGGLWLAHSIAAAAKPVTDGTIAMMASRLATGLPRSRTVAVLESSHVEAPVVIGWRAPKLILPHDATDRLSPELLAAVLEHEFAHIRRGDYLANLIQSFVEAVLFFSPLVLWMSRRIRETREFCCDDAAIDRCRDAKQYVSALTTLASLGTVNTARPALGASGPRLITRVRRLLQGEAMPRFQYARIVTLAGIAVLVFVAGLQVSAASAARAPRLTDSDENPSRRAQEKIPFGFATEQNGSGVELQRVVSTPDEPAQMFVVKNLSNQPVVGLRFLAGIERWTTGRRLPIRLFESPVVSVVIAPGQSAEVSPRVLTAAQVQTVATESPGARLQFFFGLRSVSFANGFEWNVTANAQASSGPDALNIPKPVYSRDLITRDATRPAVPYGPCRDDRNRATSHGGRVPILHEPGHTMVCDNGRWVESQSGR